MTRFYLTAPDLGGSGSELGFGIAVDALGNAYVTGLTTSANFPTEGEDQTLQGGQDVFVTKLDSSGNALVYSTYLGGGTNFDGGLVIAVDDFGNAYITGFTASTDFPTLNPYQATFQGGWDVFVTKLNSSGNALVYSTYLGGSSGDVGQGIAVDGSGNAYITGYTNSTDFPTESEYQTDQIGMDVFVTKLNSSGDALVYSTYLGGSGFEAGGGIAADSSGNAYVTGYTFSTDFPTEGEYQTYQGGGDAFVTKLNSSGNALVYSTYLGGTESDGGSDIAVDNSGNAYIIGGTTSTDFPTEGAYQSTLQGGDRDAFVTKLNSSGNALVYSTYLGGASDDNGAGIAVDDSGNAYVTGWTESANFPIVGEYQTDQGGGDAFVTKLNSSGNALVYSTYLGGASDDNGLAIAVDESGNAYITGYTFSTDFPTVGAYQTDQGGEDAFVTKFMTVSTDVNEFDFDNLPKDYNMSQNYPNPFNPTTTIEFNLPKRSNVSINIYNLLGQKVKQLINQEFSAGNYRVTWDGTTSNGERASTGVYFYRIQAEGFIESKKMLLLK